MFQRDFTQGNTFAIPGFRAKAAGKIWVVSERPHDQRRPVVFSGVHRFLKLSLYLSRASRRWRSSASMAALASEAISLGDFINERASAAASADSFLHRSAARAAASISRSVWAFFLLPKTNHRTPDTKPTNIKISKTDIPITNILFCKLII
ncbi:hypothetical protein [Roseibium aestuarii]|uniref:Uncharacterized protein n=1 Tax=Roseibium aestuarii TaxID=2600299 RepID=A0ABW4JZ91_9HYPH|nr:hypothetical protein [Roseibium aestuarii]